MTALPMAKALRYRKDEFIYNEFKCNKTTSCVGENHKTWWSTHLTKFNAVYGKIKTEQANPRNLPDVL